MRFYSFTNFYLSSIQQGIQPGHAAVELFVKYGRVPPNSRGTEWKKNEMLYDWAANHKTFICLNGGNHKGISDIAKFFDDKRNPCPFAVFYEDQQSLGGLMTSVGIVIPEKIYATAENERRSTLTMIFSKPEHLITDDGDQWETSFMNTSQEFVKYSFSDWERDLIVLLNSCKLA